MKRKWDNHELVERWTIDEDDRRFIRSKRGANRLGFALLLKFFQLKGSFPEQAFEISRVVRVFVADQLEVDEKVYRQYDWDGRAIKRHRVEIRQRYGFHRMGKAEFAPLRKWLVNQVLPEGVTRQRLKERLYKELKVRQIEPPTYGQVERLLNSAQRQFDVQLCHGIMEQLPVSCRRKLDELTGPQSDSWILDPADIPLNQLKQEAGGASLGSLKAEVSKLHIIQQVGLPDGLFSGCCITIVERYQARVFTETLTELRQHPDSIRYTLLAGFCWLRSQELIDNIVELFILLVHRLESRSRKRATAEVLAHAQGSKNHDKLLYQVALAALSQPEGTIEEVIYPVVSEGQLEEVVNTLGEGGRTFRERLHTKLRRAYTHYYRRLLPLIFNTLDLRCEGSHQEPLMEGIALLKEYGDQPVKVPYPAEVNVPLDGVLSPEWQTAVTTVGVEGEPTIDRATYELALLRTVREKLRCKELWVMGAKRYRNPHEDLPKDFEMKREHYYQDLQQPLGAESFISQLQADMTEALTQLNQGLPDNPKVRLLNHRDGWIQLTPLTEQPEPEHLRQLKSEISQRWSVVPLLDVLKETEVRLQFTEHFKSTVQNRINFGT